LPEKPFKVAGAILLPAVFAKEDEGREVALIFALLLFSLKPIKEDWKRNEAIKVYKKSLHRLWTLRTNVFRQ
jgi:hypothetical protein